MITPAFGLTATERVLPSFVLDWTTGLAQDVVDVTRAGVATFVGANGFIQSAAENTQRVDYSTGVSGILVEESRTNLLLQSEDFGTTWSPTNLNTTGTPAWLNVATSPANTLTADKLIEDTATGAHDILQTFTGTAVNHTFSCYLQKDERFFCRLRLWDGSANTALAIFNLNTGTVAFVGSGSATIVNAGNGWYRCTITGLLSTSASCQAVVSILDNAASASYTGDGTSGIYIWGAQLEAGAFPTSYIPTEASAVTRNADVATVTDLSFFNASEGTFVSQAVSQRTQATGVPDRESIFTLFTDATTILRVGRGTGNNVNFIKALVLNTSTQAYIGNEDVPVVANEPYRFAFGYKQNNFGCAYNGGAIATDTSGSVPAVDTMRIGSNVADTLFINGFVQKIMYFPHRLTNAELQAFSK
jgi:hypothetical protein